MLEWTWKSAGQTEREEFAKAHYEEIRVLAKAPDDRRQLRELKPDDDPLAIPTFLRRGKAQSHDPSSDEVEDVVVSDTA
jgi:hypothetical protein